MTVHLAAKEISNSRKTGNRLRGAWLPAPLNLGRRLHGYGPRNLEEANVRILRSSDLFLGVIGRPRRPLHVGLT